MQPADRALARPLASLGPVCHHAIVQWPMDSRQSPHILAMLCSKHAAGLGNCRVLHPQIKWISQVDLGGRYSENPAVSVFGQNITDLGQVELAATIARQRSAARRREDYGCDRTIEGFHMALASVRLKIVELLCSVLKRSL